jgi:hypothetical protein
MDQKSHNISKHRLKGLGVQSVRILHRLRRALAKAIEPKRPEPNLMWDIPIQGSLGGANQLREKLAIREEAYLFVSGSAFADCRAYVLYTALDEVTKTAMCLIRLQELMQGPQISAGEDMVSRLVISHTIEEQHMRQRRLFEVLITLVMFETTNEQEYYRHLLLLENLDERLAANYDLQEFYGVRSRNIDFSIAFTIKEIRQIENTIDVSKCWYRHPNLRLPLPELNQLRPGKILSSFRSKLISALPLMSDNEKLLFGFSYAGYAQKSESVHYQTNPPNFVLHPGEDTHNVYALGLLNFAVLSRCNKLLGQPDVPMIRKLSDSNKDPNIRQIVHKLTERNISKGDFVLAYGDLAEVLEVCESRYGYRSYKVRYLAERPVKEIKEDWFPAFYIQPFYTRSRFIEQLRQMASRGEIPMDLADKVENFSTQQIQKILRVSLIENWKRGLRDWVRTKQKGSTVKSK